MGCGGSKAAEVVDTQDAPAAAEAPVQAKEEVVTDAVVEETAADEEAEGTGASEEGAEAAVGVAVEEGADGAGDEGAEEATPAEEAAGEEAAGAAAAGSGDGEDNGIEEADADASDGEEHGIEEADADASKPKLSDAQMREIASMRDVKVDVRELEKGPNHEHLPVTEEGDEEEEGEDEGDSGVLEAETASEEAQKESGSGGGEDVIAGWIRKKGAGSLSKYKNRYIVLDQGVMSYYHDKDAYDSGAAPLRGNKVPLDAYIVGADTKDKSGMNFHLKPKDTEVERVGKRVWNFQAPSQEVRDDWVEVFREEGAGAVEE